MSLWSRTPPVDSTRWVVLDVETSGLDTTRDRLLAIAAVAVGFTDSGPRIVFGDSFEVVLRQQAAPIDRANILLHGIGVGAQRDGVPPAEALQGFERWVGTAPLLAFHSSFDEQMIGRTMKQVLGRRLRNPWLDLAQLAPALQPGVPARALDEWLAHFGIHCAQRHQAAADTLATAELLLCLWPALRAQRCGENWAAVSRLAAQARWLPR